MKNIILEFICIVFLICVGLTSTAQEENSAYSKFTSNFGYAQYCDGAFSKQVLDNRIGLVITGKGYFIRNKRIYFRGSYSASFALLTDNIEIKEVIHEKGDRFALGTYNVCLGYDLKIYKILYFSLYSGLLFNEYSIENSATEDKEYYTQLGVPFGVDIELRIDINKERGLYYTAFFNNSINYSGLKNLNSDLSNYYYCYEVGVGFGKKFKNPKKRNSKKRKK